MKAQLYTAGADKKEELRKATLPEPGVAEPKKEQTATEPGAQVAVVNFPATKERQPGDDEEEMPPAPAPAGQAATASGGPKTIRVMALIDESPTLADLSKLVPRIQALPPEDVGPTKKHPRSQGRARRWCSEACGS